MQIITHKVWLLMQLTTLFILLAMVTASASTRAQSISFTGKNVALTTVFKAIKEQTGYTFFFKSEDLRNLAPVSLELKEASLKGALSDIFAPHSLTYDIVGKTIFVKKGSMYSEREGVESPEAPMQSEVRGRIVDSLGQSLVGASIRVLTETGERTRLQTSTDQDGEFYLSDVPPNASLEISYLGYVSRTVKVSAQVRQPQIVLQSVPSILEDVTIVVNTGFQELPRERATGSFKVISSAQLEKPATNLAQRLVGTTAGLAAISDADGNSSLRVRGLTSLNAGSEPLVVVDGFPVEGAFNTLNPNNIESLTILKDAAAASIWGARSANGVIVITTKSGKKGRPFQADVNAFTRIGAKLDLDYVRPMASASEIVDFEKFAYGKYLSFPNPGSFDMVIFGTATRGFSLMNEHALGRITLAERDAGLERLRALDNKAQIRDYILENPISNQVNINMSGSSEKMNNATSILYETNQTDFKRSDNQRILLNHRSTAHLFDWLDLETATMLQYQKANRNGFSMWDLYDWGPYDMLLDENGDQTKFYHGNSFIYMPTLELLFPHDKFPYDYYYNPIRELNARDFSTEQINGRVQAGLTAKLFAGWSVSSKIQYENFNTFNRDLKLEDSYEVRSLINHTVSWDRTPGGMVTLNLPKGGILDQSRSKMRGYAWRNQLNVNQPIGEHHTLDLIAGTEIRSAVSETFVNPTTYGYNDQTLAVGQFPNGPGGPGARAITTWLGHNRTFPYTNSFTYRTDRYFSSFANLGYTYLNKYTLSGSFRTDASNLIAADPAFRYSPFWSIGGLWQASKESFLSNTGWLDRLALRLTYGYNGNEDRSTSPLPLISVSGTPNANTGATTASISSFGNPTLRWEKTGTVNAGIDFSVFGGKLAGSIEGYHKQGRDLLASVSIPVVNGVASQRLNNVEMYNRGIEFDLNSSLRVTDRIGWMGNVTFAYNENKITRLFSAQYEANNLLNDAFVEGENANLIWSMEYAGIVDGYPSYKGPGDGYLKIGEISRIEARDWLHKSGTTVAPYTLGLINTFDIHDFSLSFIAVGKFGHVFRRSGFNYPYDSFFKSSSIPNARLSEVMNGDPSEILTFPTNPDDPNYALWPPFADVFHYLIESANHVRLQEVSLAYRFDPMFMRRLGFSGLRVYAQGNDLVTITNNKYNEDPEFTLGTLKPTPRFTFGLNIQL